MAKKGTDYYFDTFTKGVSFSCEAAALLRTCFEDYQPDTLRTRIDEMHTIEHTADEVKHEMMERLVKEFLPPIEREDIMELSHAIDEVTDCIEDVLLRMYMFNVTALRADVMEFTNVISRCCEAMKEMTVELPNFRKPGKLRERIIEINRLEEEGDRLYTEAMRRLYTEEKDPVAVIAWTAMYDRLEKCCDGCEHVADAVEQIIMKNT